MTDDFRRTKSPWEEQAARESSRRHESQTLSSVKGNQVQGPAFNAEGLRQQLEGEYRSRKVRRKLLGGFLFVLGIGTTVTSCPLHAVSLIGPGTLIAGLGLAAAGGALLFLKTKMKESHRAILIALKNNNRITIPRLALEMDVSFQRGEQIVQDLIKNGLAELDPDFREPDDTLVYRIRGR
ncbi:MAG: hypothetical protein V2B18_17280 [Pseudomonadota bacterium]